MYGQYAIPYCHVKQLDAQSVMPYFTGMKTERLEMRVRPEWLAKIDEWRRVQPSIPSRSDAVRALVDLGLKVSSSEKRQSDPKPEAG